jgi:hypothetical protein
LIGAAAGGKRDGDGPATVKAHTGGTLGCTVSARFTSNLLSFYEWLLEACILTQACWSAPPLPERVSQKPSVNRGGNGDFGMVST